MKRHQVNVSALQDVLEMITFCDIEREGTQIQFFSILSQSFIKNNIVIPADMGQLDPNFVKLFQLSQLMLEYLLYSQVFCRELC